MKTVDSISPENVTNSVKIKNFSKYGRYSVKDRLELEFPNTKIIISSIDNEKFSYQRTNSENESTNKIISAKSPGFGIEIAPVIPVNLPKHKTDFLFLRLIEKLFLNKNASTEVFIPLPIEIGVFYVEHDKAEPFDFFTCDPFHSRYGLYGPPEEGKLCKYAKVSLMSANEESPFVYAKMKVFVHNELDKGVSLGKIVFPVTDHELYYKDANVLVDNLKVAIKHRGALELVGVIQDTVKKPDGWTKSPTHRHKTDYKFSMEKGFD